MDYKGVCDVSAVDIYLREEFTIPVYSLGSIENVSGRRFLV